MRHKYLHYTYINVKKIISYPCNFFARVLHIELNGNTNYCYFHNDISFIINFHVFGKIQHFRSQIIQHFCS